MYIPTPAAAQKRWTAKSRTPSQRQSDLSCLFFKSHHATQFTTENQFTTHFTTEISLQFILLNTRHQHGGHTSQATTQFTVTKDFRNFT